jgi:putative DNA primase/helicase
MLESTKGDKLTLNEKSEEAKKDFAEHNDPLTEFFFEYDKQFFLDVKGTDAYARYKEWADTHYISYPLGLKKFKEAVMVYYNLKWGIKTIKATTPSGYTTIKGFKE